ncbi:MAG TPA: RMD1 family protein [Rhizomicrobium sp.]|jgi:uncharacterized Rmd1/YagE family protein
MTNVTNLSPRVATPARPLVARAVLLGDRLAIDRSKHADVISTSPYCFRKDGGYATVFRYGVVVFIGLSPTDETAILAEFSGEVVHHSATEEERIGIELHPDLEEGPTTDGKLYVKALTAAHALVLSDILAKSVALARYERETASVFDTIEPVAQTLAVSGHIPKDRKALLQLIGSALLAQHRVSGRIAFAEKPDILWDQPGLERLYARLEDEYEIIERGTLLNGKMSVLSSVAETFTDMMDTARSARLELLIVILILAELIIAAVTLFRP